MILLCLDLFALFSWRLLLGGVGDCVGGVLWFGLVVANLLFRVYCLLLFGLYFV